MERVHIDFCEYRGRMILVMVDSFSKKIWTSVMGTDTTSLKTLAVLYGWFCEEAGFPTTLVSDNGPQLVSKEFKEKMNRWGIRHLLSPPYHPASNGLAERAVGLVKDRLKKMNCSAAPVSLHVGLKTICRVHGLTPHRSTGRCPFELHREGPSASLFPRLIPNSSQRSEQSAVSHSVGRLRKKSTFAEGEEVIVYDLKSKLSSTGKILEVLGNNTYLADCGNGPQHTSGDVISRISGIRKDSKNGSNPSRQQVEVENSDQDVLVDQDMDIVSVTSDSSKEQDIDVSDVIPVINVPRRARRYRCRAEMMTNVRI